MSPLSRRRPRSLAFLSVFCLTFTTAPSVVSSFAFSNTIQPLARVPATTTATTTSSLHMSAIPRKPLVSVSIDQSLLPDNLYTKPLRRTGWKPSVPQFVTQFLALLSTSSVLKIALVSFLGALGLTLLLRGASSTTIFKSIQGRLQALWEGWRAVAPMTHSGEPMPFDANHNDGWGVATLRAKRRLGKTSFVLYDFDLPQPDYYLPLDLGQSLRMCCLDNEGQVGNGEFYEYKSTMRTKKGAFSIVVPNRSAAANAFAVGEDTANLMRILKQDLKLGDEVAIQPGDHHLSYRGQYLPVTDMLYIASGVGIVPVLEQVRAVLPKGSSTVTSVTVLWVNDSTKDFDTLSELLEREYYKYSSKLAVSCVVDDLRINAMADNSEIQAAVPRFTPGTMAVLAGPKETMRRASSFLQDMGYPADTICVL